MPTYDYLCENCGYRFEKMQSIKAGSLRKCPECGKMSLKKLISAGAGLIFKGSGFYKTDYRSADYKASQSKDKKPTKEATCKKECQSCKHNPDNKTTKK